MTVLGEPHQALSFSDLQFRNEYWSLLAPESITASLSSTRRDAEDCVDQNENTRCESLVAGSNGETFTASFTTTVNGFWPVAAKIKYYDESVVSMSIAVNENPVMTEDLTFERSHYTHTDVFFPRYVPHRLWGATCDFLTNVLSFVVIKIYGAPGDYLSLSRIRLCRNEWAPCIVMDDLITSIDISMSSEYGPGYEAGNCLDGNAGTCSTSFRALVSRSHWMRVSQFLLVYSPATQDPPNYYDDSLHYHQSWWHGD